MNPLTNVRNIQKLNQTELQLGSIGKKSWHDQYKDSAWLFIGGLPYDLTEGDILCVFSQYGEIVNINLVRDKGTGKSKGYGFLCYEDQRSTVLAVDNLNSIKLLGRIIRVDHVESYKIPKEHGDEDDVTKKLREEGCAPKIKSSSEDEESFVVTVKKAKKVKDPDKKSKKKKKKEKKKKKVESASASSSEDERSHDKSQPIRTKKEKIDPWFDQQERQGVSPGDRFERDRRDGGGGFERDRREGGGGFERDRRDIGGGFERDRRDGGGGFERDRREGGGAFERDRREGGGAFERDRREGVGGYERDRRDGAGGYERDRRDMGGAFERDGDFNRDSGYRNGMVRSQDRRNERFDRGREDRRDNVWRDREREDFRQRRGDNSEDRFRGEFRDRDRYRRDDRSHDDRAGYDDRRR